MLAYRLCRAGFKALDGEGARLWGGRWNSPGHPVVYASSTLALAALEYLVHVHPGDVPADLIAVTISIPDDIAVELVDESRLDSNWARTTGSVECQSIGNAWLAAGSTALLRVPAAPIPEETNLLINQQHADARRIRISRERAFQFDPRLGR